MKSLVKYLICCGVLFLAAGALAQTFVTGDAPIAIPDVTGTLGTCQTISVPMSIVIMDIDVQISAAHSFVGDLTFQVTSPAPSSLTLINRPGRVGAGFGNSANYASATPINYNDAAPSAQSAEDLGEAPVGTACGSTTVVGSTCGPDNYVPAPNVGDTPIAGTGTNLAQYNGADAMGMWTLCVGDSAGGDTGTLSAWQITIVPQQQQPNLIFNPDPKAVSPAGPVISGDIITYTITVQNIGNGPATNVVVQDFIPAMTTYVSDDCGGSNVPPWTWNIGNLAASASVTCNLMVQVDPAPLPQGQICNQGYTVDSTETAPVTGSPACIDLVPVELMEFESSSGE